MAAVKLSSGEQQFAAQPILKFTSVLTKSNDVNEHSHSSSNLHKVLLNEIGCWTLLTCAASVWRATECKTKSFLLLLLKEKTLWGLHECTHPARGRI